LEDFFYRQERHGELPDSIMSMLLLIAIAGLRASTICCFCWPFAGLVGRTPTELPRVICFKDFLGPIMLLTS
jgi:hypothetical protein